MTRENPADFATVTHCLASKLEGKKTDGSDFPSPHSESVKVLVPKWKKMAISVSCHESCWEVGMGRSGSGGGGGGWWRRGREEGREKVRRRRKMRILRYLLDSSMAETQKMKRETVVV